MRWSSVRAWRDRLAESDPTPFRGPLSPEGMRAAWDASLSALSDEALSAAAARQGVPFERAVIAVARAVVTAPVEWCAVLLGRGTHVHIKHPSDDPGITALLVESAQAEGLPLTASGDRSALESAPLIVAMGRDTSVQEIARAHPDARVLQLGSRFSFGLVTREDSLPLLAEDAALHDGRGCMSPVFALTTLPLPLAVDRLADAMEQLERRLPRGEISPREAATLRTRTAIARATGLARTSSTFAVLGLPTKHLSPVGAPRMLTLAQISEPSQLPSLLAPWLSQISTIGADVPLLPPLPSARICALGQMQRPPLLRLHDGLDWLGETLKEQPIRGS